MSDVIGILGGMGPRATVRFEEKLIASFSGSDQEIPTIVTINDGLIPDRSLYLCGAGLSPVSRLRRNIEALMRLGVNTIAIPCNTAHVPQILDPVVAGLSLEVIHMPEQTVRHLQNRGTQSVAVLGTEGMSDSGMYQAIGRRLGVRCLVFKSTQQLTSEVIAAVKAGKMECAQMLAEQLAVQLCLLGVQTVVLACTELSFVITELSRELQVVDSLEVLVAATKNRILNLEARSRHETR